MTGAHSDPGGQGRPYDAARSLLWIVSRAYFALAAISVGALAAVYALPVEAGPVELGTRRFLAGLLTILFFAATVINLGVQWAARIIAARRYRRDDPRPAAAVVAVSQSVAFAVYASVTALVVYYRLKIGADATAAAPALASVAAGYYFLRLPRYMHQQLYVEASHDAASRGDGAASGEGGG